MKGLPTGFLPGILILRPDLRFRHCLAPHDLGHTEGIHERLLAIHLAVRIGAHACNLWAKSYFD